MNDVERDVPDPNAEGQDLSPEYSVPIDPASLARHYELDDVNTRLILRYAGALLVAMTIVHIVLYFMLRSWTGEPLWPNFQIAPANVASPSVPGPGLDASPEIGLGELQARERERLNSYGWIDRDAGTVRIPIERAMDLFVENGVAAQEGETPNFGLGPAFRLDSSGGVQLENDATGGQEAGDGEVSDEEAADDAAIEETSTEDAETEEDAADE